MDLFPGTDGGIQTSILFPRAIWRWWFFYQEQVNKDAGNGLKQGIRENLPHKGGFSGLLLNMGLVGNKPRGNLWIIKEGLIVIIA